MPKAELTTFVTPKCQALAQRVVDMIKQKGHAV